MLWSKQSYHLTEQDDHLSSTATTKEDLELNSPHCPAPRSSNRTSLPTICLIVFLIIVIISQHVFLKSVHHVTDEPSSTGLDLSRDLLYRGHVDNRYFSDNETESDLAWEGIRAGHGAVSLDPSWSKTHNIPETMKHPLDPTKGAYFIAAYHGIHCLQYLRRHYKALMRGDNITWSIGHDMHCFDSLRQQVMCHADDTILYTGGHRDVGHGQARLCKNWDALREWATERTACYWDLDYPGTETRWGRCDGGDDGLPRGGLLG